MSIKNLVSFESHSPFLKQLNERAHMVKKGNFRCLSFKHGSLFLSMLSLIGSYFLECARSLFNGILSYGRRVVWCQWKGGSSSIKEDMKGGISRLQNISVLTLIALISIAFPKRVFSSLGSSNQNRDVRGDRGGDLRAEPAVEDQGALIAGDRLTAEKEGSSEGALDPVGLERKQEEGEVDRHVPHQEESLMTDGEPSTQKGIGEEVSPLPITDEARAAIIGDYQGELTGKPHESPRHHQQALRKVAKSWEKKGFNQADVRGVIQSHRKKGRKAQAKTFQVKREEESGGREGFGD